MAEIQKVCVCMYLSASTCVFEAEKKQLKRKIGDGPTQEDNTMSHTGLLASLTISGATFHYPLV